MYASPSDQQKLIGPYFLQSMRVQVMELPAPYGTNNVPTFSFAIDVQDIGNQLFRVGFGCTIEMLRDIIAAIKSELDTSGESIPK